MSIDPLNTETLPAGATAGEALPEGLVLDAPRGRRRAAVRAWHVAAAACVGGVTLVVAAAGRAEEPASSPIDAPGLWGAGLAVGVAIAFAGYVGAVLVLRRPSAPIGAVLLVAAAVQLAPLAGPTLLSTDAWTYWMYGRVGAELGGNPYGDAPSRYPGDAAYAAMGSSWRETPSLYGPVFTLGSELHAAVAGDDPDRAAWLYRALAALATLGTAVIACTLARRPALAAAVVGWNPLLALHFGGGGHNDAAMMLLVVAALALAARSRPNLAGAAWVAAVGVKWVAAAFLALWGLDRWRRREPLGLAGLAAAAAALVAVASVRYGATWLDAFDGLSSQARRTGSIGLSKWLADVGLGHRAVLGTITLALLAAFAWLALEAWRGRRRLGLAGSAAALGQGWLNPWYASWGVSLSATEDDGAARLIAVALTGFLLLDVVPR